MIRNIIFDFGGVIIDIDFQRTIDAFKVMGAKDFDLRFSQASQSGIFDELDKGRISEDEFTETLRQWLPPGISREEVREAWNRIILDIPSERILLLQSLKNNYRTFLLSNTNSIHYALYTDDLKRQHGISGLHALFEKVFLSFELGMRKPDREIFEYVFRVSGCSREESLFIDDSLHIAEAACTYGIPVYWLQKGQEVGDLFEDGLLRKDLDIWFQKA